MPKGGWESRRQAQILAVAGVVLAVVLVTAAYGLTNGFRGRPGGSTTITVVPQWTYESIPGEQYDEAAFVTHSTTKLDGSFTDSLGIVAYFMTPADVESLSKTGVVGGFNWTSGAIPDFTLYNLTITLSAGPWDFVLYNPSAVNTTVVDFWTAVTETPS